MKFDGTTFDFSEQVAEQPKRELPPPGTYTVEVDSFELKPTKTGGEQLVLKLALWADDGKFVSWHWHRINTKHTNEKVVYFGMKNINEIRTACGLPVKFALADLTSKKFIGEFELKDSGSYGIQLEMKAVKNLGEIPF